MTHIPWTNNDNIDPVNSNLDVVVNLDTNDSTIILVHPVPASRFIGTTTEDLLRIRQHLLANPELKSITHQGGGFYVRPEIMVRVRTRNALEQVLYERGLGIGEA